MNVRPPAALIDVPTSPSLAALGGLVGEMRLTPHFDVLPPAVTGISEPRFGSDSRSSSTGGRL